MTETKVWWDRDRDGDRQKQRDRQEIQRHNRTCVVGVDGKQEERKK